MGRERNELGRAGERFAAGLLVKRGYRIVARNVRTPFGELDAVATQGPFLVFIEVKTRSSDALGPPSLNVTWQKQRHIVKSALWYLAGPGRRHNYWRIDIVSVRLGPDRRVRDIEIIENAVQDDGY